MKKQLSEGIKISIVMALHNSEEYVEDAVYSVLNQTFSNFELIIVNDASTDNSLKVIKKIAEKDRRIIIIDLLKNVGVSNARNVALDKTRGEFIVIMDSDDVCKPDRLEVQIDFLEKNLDYGVCGSWLQILNENGEQEVWRSPIEHFDILAHQLFYNAIYNPTVMIRASIIRESNISYDTSYAVAEDYNLWYSLHKFCKFKNIPKVLLLYRKLNDGKSLSFDPRMRDMTNRVIKNFISELELSTKDNQLAIHFAISSWDKFYLLKNKNGYENWVEQITLANSLTNYTSEEAMQKLFIDYENKLKRFDSHALIYLLDKHFGVTRYTDSNKLVMVIQKVSSVLPKKFIAKFL